MIDEKEITEILRLFGEVVAMQHKAGHYIGTLDIKVGSGVGEISHTRIDFFINQEESHIDIYKLIVRRIFQAGVVHGRTEKANEIKRVLGMM